MSCAMNQAMTLSQPNRPLLIEHLRMREIENGTGHSRRFETILPPLSVSAYTKSNAFGGMSIALIIQAAFHTLSQQESSHWVPYSIMGYFLGPVSTSAPVIIEVENVRSSKRFQTRSVRVQSLSSSNNDSKKYKLSFIAMLDFCHSSGHIVHPLTDDILQSSETNSKTLEVLKKGPDAFYDWKTVAIKRQNEQNEKSIKEAVNDYKAIYDQRSKLINMRVDPESLLSKSLSAMAPIVKSKEQLKTLKCYEDPSTALEHVWKRPSRPLLPQIEQEDDEKGILGSTPASITFAQIAFNLDPRVIGSMGIINQIPFGKGQISVSLDFSIRFHVESIQVDQWHLFETQIKDQGHAKFFGETRCYNQSGRKIASASQQAALRINSNYFDKNDKNTRSTSRL